MQEEQSLLEGDLESGVQSPNRKSDIIMSTLSKKMESTKVTDRNASVRQSADSQRN